MKHRKEESYEEYISYTKHFNNYNIVWLSKERRVSTYEQDRVAQYILDNVELVDGREINKIKFMQYEKNVSTQIWSIGVEINEKILVLIKENKKIVRYGYHQVMRK